MSKYTIPCMHLMQQGIVCGEIPCQRKLQTIYLSSYVCFFSNVFYVCGWPFYAFFFFYRLACYYILIVKHLSHKA